MRILYLSPHQDDEVLTMGASIRQDLADGHNVTTHLVCRGDKSVARTNPILINRLGYTPSVPEFCAARDREFVASVQNLGGDLSIISQEAREPEQETIPSRIADTVMSTFYQGFDLVCAHTLTDPHIDHANVGRAAILLVERGFARQARFHVAFYNKSYHLTPPDPPLLSRGQTHPVTLAEQEPYRRVDVPKGFWGVGYISVSSYFINQLTDPVSYYFDGPAPPDPVVVLRTASGKFVHDVNGNIRTFTRTWSADS